jgi:hypothetical protein
MPDSTPDSVSDTDAASAAEAPAAVQSTASQADAVQADATETVTTDDTSAPAPVADARLLAAADLARAALTEITPADTIGVPLGHIVEGEHVLSLLFECTMSGYPGWHWTVTISRIDENSEPMVLETELMPGDDSLLAPEWVPWSDRLADYRTAQELAAAVAAMESLEVLEDFDEDESDDDEDDESDDDDEEEEEDDDESVEDDDDESDDDDDDEDEDDDDDDDDDDEDDDVRKD